MRIELGRADSVRVGDYVQGWQQTTFDPVFEWKSLEDDSLEIQYRQHPMCTIGRVYRHGSDMILIGRAE